MDTTTLLLAVAGVAAGGVAVYLVAIQGVKAAIQKEAKGLALDTVFKQFGLNKQGVKFWNELSPQGAATLISTLKAVQQSSGATMGAGFSGEMAKVMAQIQAMQQMAGAARGNVTPH